MSKKKNALFDKVWVESLVDWYVDFQNREYDNEVNKDEMIKEIQSGEDKEYGLAYTTAEYSEDMDFEVTMNVPEFTIRFYVNHQVVYTEIFNDIEELFNYLEYKTFEDLVDDDNFPGYSKYQD